MNETEILPKTKVRRSNAGLGLFAEEAIKKGTLIIEYTGDRISSEEADKLGGQYLFTVTDTLMIDGKGRTNKARYINHSCQPNAEAEHDEEEDRIFIRAKKLINAGEEITYHHGKEFFDLIIKKKSGGCRCSKCHTRT